MGTCSWVGAVAGIGTSLGELAVTYHHGTIPSW
jgi:hypothetical protein